MTEEEKNVLRRKLWIAFKFNTSQTTSTDNRLLDPSNQLPDSTLPQGNEENDSEKKMTEISKIKNETECDGKVVIPAQSMVKLTGEWDNIELDQLAFPSNSKKKLFFDEKA